MIFKTKSAESIGGKNLLKGLAFQDPKISNFTSIRDLVIYVRKTGSLRYLFQRAKDSLSTTNTMLNLGFSFQRKVCIPCRKSDIYTFKFDLKQAEKLGEVDTRQDKLLVVVC